MQFDYYKENPYKANEASFNSQRYKSADYSVKKEVFKWLEKLDLL